jgi:3-oxoacyl-[acyl-carrier protein] reductase
LVLKQADMDVEEWLRVIDVNLNGCFNMIRSVLPGMRDRRRGWIVNMSSVAAKNIFQPCGAPLQRDQGSPNRANPALGGELGCHGIRANAMAPGRIETPLTRAVVCGVNERILNETPMGRFRTPEEVANVCLFLTSPQSSFVTGQVIDIAGGWMMT